MSLCHRERGFYVRSNAGIMDDWQLIEFYTREKSETAFHSLVERHAGLVYASALRQVRDEQLAQDIVQAVFILFARKADGLGRNTVVSGWLFQTTRFVAARALRSEQRRRRREQEAFDMQQLSTGDEAWGHLMPVIDEALGELGRADRDAVLLRHMEGRTMREVGSALGTTEEAAKKRVARAVERLRRALARKGVVLPTATITAALTAHATVAAPTTLVTALTANAFAAASAVDVAAVMARDVLAAWRWMKLKWLAGTALSGGVIIALLLVLMPRDAAQDAAVESSPALLTAGANPAGATARPEIASSPSARARQNDPSLLHLKLRAVNADSGEGISNAAVFLSIWRKEAIEKYSDLMTDAAGWCDVAYEPDTARIDVGVMQSGWVARYATWPSEGLSGFPTEYVLRLARVTNSIGGLVRDPQGRPLAGVRIEFLGHDFGDSSHRERRREHFGFVSQMPVAHTDREGLWALGFVPPAHPGFQIEARHPDFADTSVITSAAQVGLESIEDDGLKQLWAGRLVTTMKTACSLTGRVVDERQRPISGAVIRGRANSEGFSTDASGVFRVPKLKEGTWTFTVTAEGFAPVRTNGLVAPGIADPVVVVLQPGAILRLRVVDENRLEVPDAEVGMEQWGDNRHDMEWRERTDAAGRIEWRSAPSGVKIELFARKDGFCYTRNVRVTADGTEHTIAIYRVLDVYGRVVDAQTGRAIRDFKALPGYGGPNRFSSDPALRWFAGEMVRGTNGMFKLTFKESEFPWQLRLVADGYDEWTSEPLTNRYQAVLDIQMQRSQPGDSVRGTVLLPDGGPAAGAHVALLDFEHNVTLRHQAFEGNPRWITKTGVDGVFTFPINRLAHSVAVAGRAGYAHLRVRDSREPLAIRLQSWGKVEGVIEEGAARHGVESVQLYDPATQNHQGHVRMLNSYFTTPDAGRRFLFESVPPGELSAFVNSGIGIPFHHQTPLVVAPGETTHVVIREHPGTRVIGRYLPPPGRPLPWKNELFVSHFRADLPHASAVIDKGPAAERPLRELEFWTSPAGREHINTPRYYSVIVRDDGAFQSVENVPPGRYRFVTVFGTFSASRDVVIGEDRPAELTVGEIRLY